MRGAGIGISPPSGVAARKNSAGSEFGPRRRLNLIEGANVTLTVVDDATDGEVDLTIAAANAPGWWTETGPDDQGLILGADSDIRVLHRSTLLAADAEVTGIIEGTSEHPGVAADSLIISNVADNGDILLLVSKAGNSQGVLWADGSSGDTAVMAASGASVDHYIAGTKVLDHASGAFAFQENTTISGLLELEFANMQLLENNTVALKLTSLAGAITKEFYCWQFISSDGMGIHPASAAGSCWLKGGLNDPGDGIVWAYGLTHATKPGRIELITPNLASANVIRLSLPGTTNVVVATWKDTQYLQQVDGASDCTLQGAQASDNSPAFYQKFSRGTIAVPTVSLDNDVIAQFIGQGYSGAAWITGAQIRFVIDGTPAAGVMPAEIEFWFNSGGASPTLGMKLLKTGFLEFVSNYGIQAVNTDAGVLLFQARDTGVGPVEVARLVGAADPYFSMGGSQQFKFYNSGVAVLTGALDCGGADSLEVPNAAGGKTVDAAGEACVDTTSRTLNFHDGTAEVVVQPILSKSITIEDPTATEDIGLCFVDDAVTIVKIVAVLVGSATPSVTWTIRHGTDRSAAGAEVVTGGTVTTSITTGSVVTSFNDATVVADSFIWLETTAKSGTVNKLEVTIFYRQDP